MIDESIYQAIEKGDYADVSNQLAKGSDVDGVCDPESGMTLLHLAVEHYQPKVVEVLIAKGANVNTTDVQGWTPLHRSIDVEIDQANQSDVAAPTEITRMLLTAGADPSARDHAGRTPLQLAERNLHLRAVDLMRQSNATN